MYSAILITICGLVILLCFEIRHRELVEEVESLRAKSNMIVEELMKLKEEVKLKKDAYEEYKPPNRPI